MGEKCTCGRDLRDDTNVCECGRNVRAERAEAEVKMLADAITGWRTTNERLRVAIDQALDESSCHDGSMADMVRILAAGRKEGAK